MKNFNTLTYFKDVSEVIKIFKWVKENEYVRVNVLKHHVSGRDLSWLYILTYGTMSITLKSSLKKWKEVIR